MDAESLNRYHRQLLLCCMHTHGNAIVAGDLHEAMTAVALGTSAPKDAWAGLTVNKVAGLLRTLENEKVVKRRGSVRDTRNGRDTPRWAVVGELEPNYPAPRVADVPPTRPEPHAIAEAFAGITPHQQRALMVVQDQLLTAAAEHRATSDQVGQRLNQAAACINAAHALQAESDRRFDEMVERSRRQLYSIGLESGQ